MLAACAAAVVALAVVVGVSTTLFDPGGAQASAPVSRTAGAGALELRAYPHTTRELQGPGAAPITAAPACRPVATASGYVNPLARANVNPERIDQGVDYAGSGSLVAIGAGQITNISLNETGWPGAFIEYQLATGADAGCYVYYAEGVNPAPGVHVGDWVAAGQPVASIIRGWSSGIEVGWGSGRSTETYAGLSGNWTDWKDADNIPTAAGKSFSALIAALGGRPGKVEG